MKNIVLELKDINKEYKTKAEVLNILKDINFVLHESDFVSIVGKSGSGKTTLLNILGLLDKPTSGEIYIDEAKVDNKKAEKIRNSKIGYIFQFHHLLNEFTVLENVMLPAMINKIDKKIIEEKAKELLSLVELSDRLNHKPSQLSGGEKQRVAIARSLINDPQIILADEPTGNLDNDTSNTINSLFLKINKERKKAIIIVTHSTELANMADIRYIMKNGKLIKNEV